MGWGRKNFAGIAQLVERNLAKVEVAGSSPVARSEEIAWLADWMALIGTTKGG